MSVLRKPSLRQLAAAVAALALSGAAVAADPAKKEIVFGATAGPYSDQIKLGIKPILEKQGYTVRVVEFNDYVQPNFALAQGALDANAFQHVVYLQNFAAKNKLELSELVKVPTAPIAIYSRKYKSVDAAPEGVSVAVPNDPTNQARALVVLQELGWVKLREGYDPLRVSEKDVAANPKKIKLIPLEAAQLPRSLEDTDYSFVNGNFALASGLKLTEALALEKTTPTYQNLVAVRTADLSRPYVQDIAAAYRSREFLAVTEKSFAGFVKTDDQRKLEASAEAARPGADRTWYREAAVMFINPNEFELLRHLDGPARTGPEARTPGRRRPSRTDAAAERDAAQAGQALRRARGAARPGSGTGRRRVRGGGRAQRLRQEHCCACWRDWKRPAASRADRPRARRCCSTGFRSGAPTTGSASCSRTRLLPWKSVLDNVALGCRAGSGRRPRRCCARLAWAIAAATGRRSCRADSASGSLARALVHRPACCCWTSRWARWTRSRASTCSS